MRFDCFHLCQTPNVAFLAGKVGMQVIAHKIFGQLTPDHTEPNTRTFISSCSTPWCAE